jgi:hypothetical protein
MKTIQIILISICLMFQCTTSSAQILYSLDLANSSNYTVSGGPLTPTKWSVKNEYATLITTAVQFPGNPAINRPLVSTVVVTTQSTGNLDCSEVYPDGAFVRYSINNGPWINQSFITTCGSSGNNYLTSFKLYTPAGASVRIMVNLVVNSSTEKIWLFSGGITVSDPVGADASSWVKRGQKPTEETSVVLKPELSIFPNPSAGEEFNIHISNSVSKEFSLTIYDMLGKVFMSKQVQTIDGNVQERINSEGLKSGMYTCILKSNEELYRENILISGR